MPGVGEAERAVEVAGRVHLDDPQARVLLVLGAEPAVEGAPALDVCARLEGDRARLVEALRREPHLGIRVDEGLEGPVVPAPLAQVDTVIADVHLGVDDRLADRTDALRVLDEDLVPLSLRGRTTPGPFELRRLQW